MSLQAKDIPASNALNLPDSVATTSNEEPVNRDHCCNSLHASAKRSDLIQVASAELKTLSVQLQPEIPLLPETTQSLEVHNSLVKAIPTNQVEQPLLVVYPEELVFKFAKELATKKNLKRAIARLLLSADPYSEQDWLSQAPLSLNKIPYLYKKVLDHNNKPMRYPFAVYQYVEFLLENSLVESREGGGFVLLHIPVSQKSLSVPVQQYNHYVSNYASQFKVAPELVFAIMEVESSFNPKAVSKSNALGLMQIKADTAGRDVYASVDFKIGKPSRTELFDEQSNIRMGTAYMGLLKHEYLGEVRNAKNREMLLISSYNGGISTVLKLFGETSEKAIQRINQMQPRQVYRSLRYELTSDETRHYLDKVLKMKAKYSELLAFNT